MMLCHFHLGRCLLAPATIRSRRYYKIKEDKVPYAPDLSLAAENLIEGQGFSAAWADLVFIPLGVESLASTSNSLLELVFWLDRWLVALSIH